MGGWWVGRVVVGQCGRDGEWVGVAKGVGSVEVTVVYAVYPIRRWQTPRPRLGPHGGRAASSTQNAPSVDNHRPLRHGLRVAWLQTKARRLQLQRLTT